MGCQSKPAQNPTLHPLSIDSFQATLAGAPGKQLKTLSLKAVAVSHHTQGQVPPQSEATAHRGVVLCWLPQWLNRAGVPVTRPGATRSHRDCFRNGLAANKTALCHPRGLPPDRGTACSLQELGSGRWHRLGASGTWDGVKQRGSKAQEHPVAGNRGLARSSCGTVSPCKCGLVLTPPSRAAPGDAAVSVPSSMPQAQAMCEPRPCADSKNQSENQLHEAPRSQKLLLGHVNVLRKEAELFKRHRCGTWGHGLVAECWGKVGLVELFSNPNDSVVPS